MPRRARKACKRAGCPNLTDSIYCAEHDQDRRAEADRNRPTAAQRGYGARWQKLRRMVLRRQPLCACGAEATEVDHIVPRNEGGDDSFENLQGLCKPCHSTKTGRERAGGRGAQISKT